MRLRQTLPTLLSMTVPKVHLVHSWSRELSTKSSRLWSEFTRLRTALRMMVTSWSRLLPPALMRLNASYSLANRCFSALPQHSTSFVQMMTCLNPSAGLGSSHYTAITGQCIYRLVAHIPWPTTSSYPCHNTFWSVASAKHCQDHSRWSADYQPLFSACQPT